MIPNEPRCGHGGGQPWRAAAVGGRGGGRRSRNLSLCGGVISKRAVRFILVTIFGSSCAAASIFMSVLVNLRLSAAIGFNLSSLIYIFA